MCLSGADQVVRPLVDELQDMEDKPIFVSKKGKEVYLAAFVVAGDNLGTHEIQGFS